MENSLIRENEKGLNHGTFSNNKITDNIKAVMKIMRRVKWNSQ